MINCAKNKKLNNQNSNLPNVSDVIVDWFLDITFDVIERVMQGADYVENKVATIRTKGVVQPPKPKELELLPEGTWNWEWLTVHCLPDCEIQPNQFIKYDGKLYKVMSQKDWSKYGYIKYTILEAYRADNL